MITETPQIRKLITLGYGYKQVAEKLKVDPKETRKILLSMTSISQTPPRYMDYLVNIQSVAKLRALCLEWNSRANLSPTLRAYYKLEFEGRIVKPRDMYEDLKLRKARGHTDEHDEEFEFA